MSSFIEEFIARKEKAKNLIKDDIYLKWLESFTDKYRKFSDDSWLYSPTEISKEDNENVRDISLLFEALYKIVTEYYVDILYEDVFAGENFWFCYNNKYYNLGYICGQGTVFFVSKEDEAPDCIFLDLEEYFKGIKNERVQIIDNKIKELEEIVLFFEENNVPKYVLKSKISELSNK